MESKKLLQTRATRASHSENPAQEMEDNTSEMLQPSESIVEKEVSSRFKDLANITHPHSKKSNLSPMRYSQMEEDSSETRKRLMRVGIFAAVIIVVGIGAILLIESASKQRVTNTTAQSSSSAAAAVNIIGYDIGRTVLTDDNAGAIPKIADFNTSKLSLGSAANLNADIAIENLEYRVYSTLSKLKWELGGLSSGFPATTLDYIPATKKLVVSFVGIDVVNPVMLTTVSATIGPIKSITASSVDGKIQYEITFSEDIKYVPVLDAAKGTLELAIKTNVQLNITATSSSAASVSSVSSVSSAARTSSVGSTVSSAASASSVSAPAGQKLDNSFSRNLQNIASGQANTVLMRNYFYQDFGPKFEFSWTFNGTGAGSIPPAATAKYIVDEGSNYIEVKVEGVAEDFFQARGMTNASFGSLNLDYANIISVTLKSRENNISTYWVKVKGIADFRLHATGTRNDQQKLTLEIKD